jgi:hypothetical protein
MASKNPPTRVHLEYLRRRVGQAAHFLGLSLTSEQEFIATLIFVTLTEDSLTAGDAENLLRPFR